MGNTGGGTSGQAPGPEGDSGHINHKEGSTPRARSTKTREGVASTASKKESQQRQEDIHRKWEEFKAIQRDDKYSYLEQKVELQRELIRAYDDLFLERRLKTDRKLEELRKSELQKKKETEEALSQICKEELGKDKEEQLTRRAQERAAERKKQKDDKEEAEGGGEAGVEGGGDGDVPPGPGQWGPGRRLSTDRRLSMDRRLSSDRRMSEDSVFEPHDATGILKEETEDAIQEEVFFDELPLHKQRLYNLFGQEEAEYYLHPRIEPERRKVIRIPNAVKQLGGRAGAHTLWSTLRDRSQVKLKYADARIPLELKDAYGAFVRECLTKNKTVAKRSFYSETEVPESEKLQDNSYKDRVKETQRRMELMYRAALANEDKTGVLLYNNPMPDFNNFEGHEGPLRYLPSWLQVDDDSEEGTEEDKSYKKWLLSSSDMEIEPLRFEDNLESYDIDMVQDANNQEDKETDNDEQFFNDVLDYDDGQTSDRSVTSFSLPDMALGGDEDMGYPRIPPTQDRPDQITSNHVPPQGSAADDTGSGGLDLEGVKKEKKKQLVFLTEKEATCEGRFLENLAAKEKNRSEMVTGASVEAASSETKTPRDGQSSSRSGKSKVRSHTAPATTLKAGVASPSGTTPRASGTGGTRQSRRSRSTKGPEWEPLTMTALNDHKPAIQLFGGADFAHGSEFLWKPVLSTTTTATAKGT
ncbi:uncharacterized protein LOC587576 [Strongylocentrotus purpuratus]|uniref:Uncharacterized protein n=1 Tax=Strongylocentrotus purpuratus TaxID=7668 RepID=A0A7M7NUE6_STRPU|nr:uncharacterized protein LOC587576 [Strongylocentrotus purpuratus]